MAEIPNRALTDEAPVYRRPTEPPAYLADVQALDLTRLGGTSSQMRKQKTRCSRYSASPTIASKRWVYRQYDHMVQTNTINLPGSGAGVVRIKGTARALAMSVDGNGRYCYLDPRLGAMLAVAEASRNVACPGARPLGATNCLNFGNPERPAIMWQFAEAVEGIGEACRALGVPITGGNVSLYNETDGRAIYPTPVIGVVGLLEHADRAARLPVHWSRRGRRLAGRGPGRARRERVPQGDSRNGAGHASRTGSRRRARASGVAYRPGGLAADPSAHDCADGGLAVTVAEGCFGGGGIGAEISIDGLSVSRHAIINEAAALFGESPSRVVVSTSRDLADEVLERAAAAGVPAEVIGRTGGSRLRIAVDGETTVDVAVADAERVWASAIGDKSVRRVA